MTGKSCGEYFIACDVGAPGCSGNYWTAQTKKAAAEKVIKQAGWVTGKTDACPNCKKRRAL